MTDELLQESVSFWLRLPNETTLRIFILLEDAELLACALACKHWYQLFCDPMLWKRKLQRRYASNSPLTQTSSLQFDDLCMYMSTYQRLQDEVPRVCVQELKQHSDEVLHVSFSHNAHLAATCSRDSTTRIWKINRHMLLEEKCVVSVRSSSSDINSMDSAHRSYFSPDDSYLAICGALADDTLAGVVKVYDVATNRFTVDHVVMPSDVYTTWISVSDLIIGYGDFDRSNKTSLFTLYRVDARCDYPLEGMCCIKLPGEGFIRQLSAACMKHEQSRHLFYVSDGEWTYPNQVACVDITMRKNSTGSDGHHLPTVSPSALADLNSFIVGLQVSADGSLVFVNCRPITSGNKVQLDNKLMASEKMELRVFMASKLELLHIMQGHAGYSQSMCYYILLDSSTQLVARQVIDTIFITEW